MKKRYITLVFFLTLLILLPMQILADSDTLTDEEPDGTKYTMAFSFPDKYIIGELFDLDFELTADVFGTLSGVIEEFYDITIYVTVSGDTYFLADNTTLSDINVEGGSSSTTLTLNFTGITDDEVYITTQWRFMGNNTQGDDPEYGMIWGIGRVRVKEASLGIILPMLAVLSLAYIANKKRKK